MYFEFRMQKSLTALEIVMKRTVALIAFALALAAVAGAWTFDLKTHTAEMADLAALSAGFSYYLVEAGHTVFDVGEDYAIWLTDYTRTKRGNSWHVRLQVKLTEATAFKEKEALASLWIEFDYDAQGSQAITTDEPVFRFLRKKLSKLTETAAAEAMVGGKAVMDRLAELLRKAGVR